MGCETARLLKLTTNSVEPLSFFVPRKSEQFQEDLYPNTSSNEPSHTADQWLAGSNRPPRLMSLNPSAKPGSIAQAPVVSTPHVVIKTVSMLQRELDEANLRIKSLEAQMARAGISPM